MGYYEIGKILISMGYKTKKEYMVVVAPLKGEKKISEMINYLKQNPKAEFQEIVNQSLKIAEKN